MRAVFLIAWDQLADFRHRRLVLALLVAAVSLALVLALLAQGMSAVSKRTEFAGKVSDEERMQLQLGVGMGSYMLQTALYLVVFIGGSVVSLATFCGLISTERTRGTLPWVLSKPITRTQFLLGKWVGACAMILLYTAVMFAILIGSTWLTEKSVPARMYYACSVMPFGFLLVGSVGAFLSTLMPPVLAGVVAYFGGAQLFHRLADWAAPWRWLDYLLTGLHYVAPSYDKFNMYLDLLMGKEIPLSRPVVLAAYAVAYSALMFLLTTLVFQRRDVA